MMGVAGGEVQSGLILKSAVSLAPKSTEGVESTKHGGGKDETGKVENWETMARGAPVEVGAVAACSRHMCLSDVLGCCAPKT